MMEYFTYKKVKKHQEDKKRAGTQVETPKPVLSEEDEYYLERIVSAEGTPPPLPSRPSYLNPEAGDSTENDAQVVVHDGAEEPGKHQKQKSKGKEHRKLSDKEKKAAKKAANRFSFITSKFGKKKDSLVPNDVVTPGEADNEANDINKVLDDLNLSAVNNRAFSISKESQVLVQKFTVILKDIINGGPTAYDDLVNLIEDSQGTLAKSYDHLPSFLQKLITTLPQKLTSSLAPELLMVASEAQGMAGGGASKSGGGGLKGAMKNLLVPGNLKELVTKPGAVVGMLKYIMNVLKLRWPAFMGTNILLSLGLFVLLFVFWYCHKRGRDTRLEREALERGETVESNGRVTELEDDPMLQPPRSRTSHERPDQRGLSPPRERHSHRDRDGRPSPPRERRSHGSNRERSSGDRRRHNEDQYDKQDKRR